MKTKKIITTVTLLLSIFLFISCGSARVVIPTPEDEVKNIENTSNINSNFIKANEWMVESFNNAKSVIQFKDKQAGIVKGRYLMKEGSTITSMYGTKIVVHPTFFSIITLRVKDNLARIEIDAPSGMYSQKDINGKQIGFTKELFLAEANKLIDNFDVYMKEKSSNDNW